MEVWKTAMDLVVEIYRLTLRLPSEERFGLVNQMRRAAVSVPSNVAEGAGRESDPDNKRFLFNARGSLNELETQIAICNRLGYLQHDDVQRLRSQLTRVRQLLAGTIRTLATRPR